jgi:hypothetical protein
MIRSLFDDNDDDDDVDVDASSKMFRRSTLSELDIVMDKSGGHHSFYRTESGLPQ